MKNFDWTCFTKKIAIRADMEVLYNAWVSSQEIESWFLKSATFYKPEKIARDEKEAFQAGDEYEWSWYLYDEVERGKIQIANGKDCIQFSFAGDCVVKVDFERHGEYTIVSINQSNIPIDDDSKKNIRLGCESGWSFYLINMKSVYEGGLDLRSKDESLKPMVNN